MRYSQLTSTHSVRWLIDMFRTPAAKALAFFKESPEYSDKMSITEKYNTHFASQYREKVGSRLI